MLGFYPNFKITCNVDWTELSLRVTDTAINYVHTNKYKENILYESVNSIVASLPTGGWISKSGPSFDFFVMGGIPETEILDNWFKKQFPNLTFTPATICWSSKNVPLHRDNIKNGQSSLVYPISNNSGYGTVYSNDAKFTYGTEKHKPVVINITVDHEVVITEPRVWFSIHMQEPIKMVKEVLDNYANNV